MSSARAIPVHGEASMSDTHADAALVRRRAVQLLQDDSMV
jgi:hypothetical protein